MGGFTGASAGLGRTVAEEATRGLVEILSRLEVSPRRAVPRTLTRRPAPVILGLPIQRELHIALGSMDQSRPNEPPITRANAGPQWPLAVLRAGTLRPRFQV